MLMMVLCAVSAQAKYSETMDPDGLTNNLKADYGLKDNYTTYCGITLTPMQTKHDSSKWPVSRSTDGTVRNCRIFKASPGYGLTQLHGAQSVHFENIYADGGVTLRMETGAVGDKTAIYDITARNVTNENGRCAVMFGPHSAMNGVVQVDGIVSKSSMYAVTMGAGGVKEAELKHNPDAVDGIFAEGSYVKNIRAVFGKTAQIKTHAMMPVPASGRAKCASGKRLMVSQIKNGTWKLQRSEQYDEKENQSPSDRDFPGVVLRHHIREQA